MQIQTELSSKPTIISYNFEANFALENQASYFTFDMVLFLVIFENSNEFFQ